MATRLVWPPPGGHNKNKFTVPLSNKSFYLIYPRCNLFLEIMLFCFYELIVNLANLSSLDSILSKFKHASETPMLKSQVLIQLRLRTSDLFPIFNLNNFSCSCTFTTTNCQLTKFQWSTISLSQKSLYWNLSHSPPWFFTADNGLATLLLSLDLSAAFDAIDLTILLNSLTSSFDIMGSSHNWLKSYLSNRSFSVTSGSFFSFILPSSCGVLQGSVLSPIFSQFMSHLLLQLYPLTVSINSNMLTIHSFVFLSPASLPSSQATLTTHLFYGASTSGNSGPWQFYQYAFDST